MGHYDASGRYIIDPWKVRDYVVPDLSNFKLTPFVSPKVDASKDHVPRYTYKDVLSQSEEGQEAMDKVSRQQLDQALAQIAEWARKRAADPHPRQYGVEKPPLL
ncbi:hypothetical protein DFJ74DRAFT_675237 [Hyaloraphidium curvatum]|nr:hypothetical protein DFJ74DRAFT_675237 [Hyaloraphidium curvatum]